MKLVVLIALSWVILALPLSIIVGRAISYGMGSDLEECK